MESFPFELTIKDERSAVDAMLLVDSFGIERMHFTQVSEGMDRLPFIEGLLRDKSTREVTLTMAAKYHTPESFLQKFKQARTIGVRRFLIVSGYPKKKFDAIAALELLRAQPDDSACQIFCAYNPYLPESKMALENQRLNLKLKTGLIKGVYLQIGTDLDRLARSLEIIRGISPNIKICGELALPSTAFLKKMATKPWPNVSLTKTYLSDPQQAIKETRALLDFYRAHDVTPLVLAWPFERQNILIAHDFLK